MLEKTIEKQVCDYAKKLGLFAEKFTSPGRRSVPDRMFTTPKGQIFFIEFKRLGEKPTLAQINDHTERRKRGCTVHVCDNVDLGKRIINIHVGLDNSN